MQKRFKIKYEKVEINNDFGKDNVFFNMCAVKVSSKLDVNITEFLSKLEKIFLTERYGYDFTKVGKIDISKDVDYIEYVKDENKYGSKQYINIHFNINYNLKVEKLSDDLIFILTTMFNLDAEETNNTLQNFKAGDKK